MQTITSQDAAAKKYKETPGATKSRLRLDLESLEIGQIGEFNKGTDYINYIQIYNAVLTLNKKKERQLTLRQLAAGEGSVVTRVA